MSRLVFFPRSVPFLSSPLPYFLASQVAPLPKHFPLEVVDCLAYPSRLFFLSRAQTSTVGIRCGCISCGLFLSLTFATFFLDCSSTLSDPLVRFSYFQYQVPSPVYVRIRPSGLSGTRASEFRGCSPLHHQANCRTITPRGAFSMMCARLCLSCLR